MSPLTRADLRQLKESLVNASVLPNRRGFIGLVHPMMLYLFWIRGFRKRVLRIWYDMRPWTSPFWETDDLEAQERRLRAWWEARPWRHGVV